MRQLVALSLLQQQSASDRLRGVNFAYHVEQSDPQVLSALLTTVNHDPSVNVRLAAVDALRNFNDSPVGRKGVVQALAKQDSPLVQIAILDQIVELHEKSAVPDIQFLLSGQSLNPDVRQRAQCHHVVDGKSLAHQLLGGGTHADDGHVVNPNHI